MNANSALSFFLVSLAVSTAFAISDQALIETMSGEKVLAGQLLHADLKIGEPNTLIAFTKKASAGGSAVGDSDISLNVLVPVSAEAFVIASVVACEDERDAPSLRSFFLIQADRKPDIEIGVICGWDALRAKTSCQRSDRAHFYKVSTLVTATQKTVTIQALDEDRFAAKLYGKKKPTPASDFECSFARFKSAADLKKIFLLEKLAALPEDSKK